MKADVCSFTVVPDMFRDETIIKKISVSEPDAVKMIADVEGRFWTRPRVSTMENFAALLLQERGTQCVWPRHHSHPSLLNKGQSVLVVETPDGEKLEFSLFMVIE